MVTRTVIRISPEEAKAKALTPAPAAKASSSSSSATVDSLNNDNLTRNQAIQKPKTPLCNHPSCTKRAQLPSPLCWKHGAQDATCKFTGCYKKGILHGLCPDHGGLVQLCRSRGCINKVNLAKRGGLCWMHRVKGQHDDDSDSSEDEEGISEIRLCRFRGCISRTTTDEGLCDRHSTHENDYFVNIGGHNSALSTGDSIGDNDTTKKRQKADFAIDLTDVPPQSPILKSAGRIKDGASKYTGVYFYKQMNKWSAQITIGGKQRSIGYYDNEEDAAVDYARAVFKYKGQGAIYEAEEQNALNKVGGHSVFTIDLSDVPPHPPIPKSAGHIKEGASKYTGVSFNKANHKWIAQIMIDGKVHFIGHYDNEEEAAVDYARALFKYRGQGAPDKAEKQNSRNKASVHSSLTIDLSDVPTQPPIPKSTGRIKDGASKYTGVSFHKQTNKWVAQMMIEGKIRRIGYYYNEEEAAVDYARAVFKYKGQGALDKAGEQQAKSRIQRSPAIDLSDVPPQPPILKSAGHIKEGASKYTGVSFNKAKHKWNAQIMIEGKVRLIGVYENEEEAAVDYARAPPILKSAGHIKEGASKYTGVSFSKAKHKWNAQIMIEGKVRHIGYYYNEEEAAVDYARALFKYKGDNTKKRPIEPVENRPKKRQRHNSFCIDLTDVPMQTPVPKSAGHIKQGASKYTGVHFDTRAKKWCAQINIEGKPRRIGVYENEEEAAVDYARALHKYRRDLKRQPRQNFVDLNDVPPQPLILKNDLSQSKEYSDNTRRRNVREGSSKYTGVYFEKGMNKWKAQIMIEGIARSIGYYEIEEEAAADYARAVFKYKPKKGYATYGGLDLKGIPDQPLIYSETSKSGYKGVKRNKSRWEARLNTKNLGTFDTKEEAAGIYARARYYVDKGGEQSAKKKQRAIAAVPEESIDLVAV
eukprot:scaffold3934_cov78-Skeletonema_marinoi.AAC.3